MSVKSRVRKYSLRLATGALISAAAVAGIYAAHTLKPAYPQAQPNPQQIDVQSDSQHTIACGGPVVVYGADPEHPSRVAVPGSLEFVATQDPARSIAHSDTDAERVGVFYTGTSGQILAGAAWQNLRTDELNGLAATGCVAASTDQWLVGGRTDTGSNTAVTIANPGQNVAVIQISAYTPDGAVQGRTINNISVQPGKARSFSVNGIAPATADVVLRVSSQGAAVVANLSVTEVQGIRPFGADLVDAQLAPARTLVFPAVISRTEQAASDAGGAATAKLRLLAPDADAAATVYALEGTSRREIGSLSLTRGKVASLQLPVFTSGATLIVESSAKIVGAAVGSQLAAGRTDMVWFTPAPALAAGGITVVPDGQVTVTNPHATATTLTLTDADGRTSKRLQLPPHSQQTVPLTGSVARFQASQTVHMGVTIFNDSGAAAYPVTAALPGKSQLTVYTD